MGHFVYDRVKAKDWCKTGFAKYLTIFCLNPDYPLLLSFQKEYPKTVKIGYKFTWRYTIDISIHLKYIERIPDISNTLYYELVKSEGSGARGLDLGYRRLLKQYPAIG